MKFLPGWESLFYTMLTLKCALQQVACKRLFPSFSVCVYIYAYNPNQTVASWSRALDCTAECQ